MRNILESAITRQHFSRVWHGVRFTVALALTAFLVAACGDGGGTEFVLGDDVGESRGEGNHADSEEGDDIPLKEPGAYLQAARELLEADSDVVTDEDFAESALAQSRMDQGRKRRMDRAHALAMAAEDPDPEWFSTHVDREVLVVAPGERYAVTVTKLDSEGEAIGPADPDRLQLVVRVQRDDHEFEYVPREYSADYARWDLSSGQLEVSVPADLARGRMVVGIRPDLADPGQLALAERWSTALSLEVWPVRSGVNALGQDDVLFPRDAAEPFHDDSLFSRSDVAAKVGQELEDHRFVLPLVVWGTEFSPGELVDYRWGEYAYGGRIVGLVNRDYQQLVLLSPEWLSVYDVADTSHGFMTEQGVFPEFVVYREGNPIPDYDAQYRGDPSHVGPEDRAAISADALATEPLAFTDWAEPTQAEMAKSQRVQALSTSPNRSGLWERSCDPAAKSSLVFSTEFALAPADAGMFVTASVGGQGRCKWTAAPGRDGNQGVRRFSPAGGVAGIILRQLLGGDVRTTPFGSVSLELQADAPDSLEMKAGYSHQQGSVLELGIFDRGGYGFVGLLGEPVTVKGFAEATAGIRHTLQLTDVDGLLGRVLALVGIPAPVLDLDAKAGLGAGFAVTGMNSAGVYQGFGTSGGSISSEAFAQFKPSPHLQVLTGVLGLDGDPSFEFDVKLGDKAFPAEFGFNAINDSGTGIAFVEGLSASNPVLNALFEAGVSGVMGPGDAESSIFENPEHNVTYDVQECQDNGGEISAPVVACIHPRFCGETEPAGFCGGDISVDPLMAMGYVGETVETSGRVTLGESGGGQPSQPLDASLSGNPLSPGPQSVTLHPGESQSFNASGRCNSRGVTQGTITAVVDAGNMDESENLLNCRCNRNERDCDRIWASPHLITADGLGYDYYASGDYILMTVPGVDGLEVQGRFLPGYDVSWPQAVALRVGADVVEIHTRREEAVGLHWHSLSIWVNGEKLYPPHEWHPVRETRQIRLPDGGRLFIDQFMGRFQGRYLDPIGVTVTWPFDGPGGGYGVHVQGIAYDEAEAGDYANTPPMIEIEITRPDTYAGMERGLLGNNDGDPRTDFIRRNGENLGGATPMSWTALYSLFGGDWLARPHECLFRNGCIEPQFPPAAVVLDSDQRALAKVACAQLRGWYREACMHDVGLTGSPELVQQHYAATDDLNYMADRVINPGTEVPLYTLKPKRRDVLPENAPGAPAYIQEFQVELVKGSGDYIVSLRPPAAGTARLVSNGAGSRTGSNGISDAVKVFCGESDERWQGAALSGLPVAGALQLWSVDPLSGNAGQLMGEMALLCVDSNEDRTALGASHALIVDAWDTPFASGNNVHGQLGDGSTLHRHEPVPAAVDDLDAPEFSAVEVGREYSLALGGDGRVWAWGRNDQGQLGDGSGAQQERPVEVALSDEIVVVALAAGEAHSLALASDGRLWAWGSNEYGQLGDGTTTQRNAPVLIDPESLEGARPVGVHAGEHHSFVLDDQGRIWAWGRNHRGQLGDGTTEARSSPVALELPAPDAARFVAVAAGGAHGLALDDQGQVWSWGNNSEGQLGDATTISRSTPQPIGDALLDGAPATQIVAGRNHSLALSGYGRVFGWGANGSGQLGGGPVAGATTPMLVNLAFLGRAEAASLDAGGHSSLLVDSQERLWVWGANGNGQLGIGSTINQPSPVLAGALNGKPDVDVALAIAARFIPGGDQVASAARIAIDNPLIRPVHVAVEEAGFRFSDGQQTLRVPAVSSLESPLRLHGSGICTGAMGNQAVTFTLRDDLHRLLARETVVPRCVPDIRYGVGFADGKAKVNLVSESEHDYTVRFITSDGITMDGSSNWQGTLCGGCTQPLLTEATCAAGARRELGRLDILDINEQVIDSREVACTAQSLLGGAYSHSLFVDEAGDLLAWGNNQSGQLGDGSQNSQTAPVHADASGWQGAAIVQVAAGDDHSLAIDDFGRLWAWGSGSFGQLAHDAWEQRTPVEVDPSILGGAAWEQVGAGFVHSVALDDQGRVWAWGDNTYSQLGDLEELMSTRPIKIDLSALGGSDPASIGAGIFTNLILDEQGRVWGWGENAWGVLGTGTTEDASAPTAMDVTMLAGAEAVAVAIGSHGLHSLVLDEGGRVWATGRNDHGQLGDGTTAGSKSLVPVDLDATIVAIDASLFTSLAVDDQGNVWAWGRNAEGQLGDGTYLDRATPVKTNLSALDGVSVLEVFAGEYHSLARDAAGRVWAWGDNSFGQLGDGTDSDRPTPTLVELPAEVD